MNCLDCPRKCNIDRNERVGFCREKKEIRVAKVIENFMWEEPCISGEKGALAIFFSGCNLRCQFCQNYDISHVGKGKSYTPKEFREYLESLNLDKYSSIDLITPTHFSSQLLESLQGFKSPIPIVWNSSGYENSDIINKLSSVVDVFLPDFKYYSSELSQKLSLAKDYYEVTMKAIQTMRESKPNNIFENDILTQGVLIRHLVLPGQAKDSIRLLDNIKAKIHNPFISLMSQFTPIGKGELDRKIYPLEYKAVLNHAVKIGLTDGYLQEYTSADENFIPNF